MNRYHFQLFVIRERSHLFCENVLRSRWRQVVVAGRGHPFSRRTRPARQLFAKEFFPENVVVVVPKKILCRSTSLGAVKRLSIQCMIGLMHVPRVGV